MLPMGLVNHIYKKSRSLPFDELFLSLEKRPEFPFTMALKSLEELLDSTESEQETLFYLLEDIIFASLYATFYEQAFMAIRKNPKLTRSIIQEFSNNQQSREQSIAIQTESHANFVQEGGHCPGCPFCQHHGDVAELIDYWDRNDYYFLSSFFVGMKTIQYSMEQLLYDTVAMRADIRAALTEENILIYRKKIIDHTDKHFFPQ